MNKKYLLQLSSNFSTSNSDRDEEYCYNFAFITNDEEERYEEGYLADVWLQGAILNSADIHDSKLIAKVKK